MNTSRLFVLVVVMMLIIGIGSAVADESYDKAMDVFQKSEAVQPFIKNAYGYAIFPTIGKGGIGIGGAYGKGKVYKGKEETGEASLIKATIGFQLGGQAFSEVIFFEDQRAYDEFTSGEFAFDASASAVAITAGAQANAGTAGGATAGASAGPATGAQAKAQYHKGMAVFIHAKGGLMYEAAVGGQKFSFKPKGGKE